MAQPSQQYPPWLTPIASVVTDAAGDLTTSITISYIPPTYFGPSIPLGSLYIFGGTTEPATIVLPGGPTTSTSATLTTSATPSTTALTTTATPTSSVMTSATPTTSVITSATPTFSITIPVTSTSSTSASSISSTVSLSTSLTATSLLSSTSSASTLLPSTTSSIIPTTSSSVPSATGGPAQAAGLTKGQLVGVIVASILGLIFLFVLALFIFLWLKGRRNRRQFTTLTPIDEDYFIVPSGGHTPGEGSPRHSGEEADPFLQRRAETSAAGAAAMSQAAGGAVSRPGRVPPPTTGSHSSDSTNSNASGFGVLLDRPSLGLLPSMPEHAPVGGVRLSAGQMERLDHEHVLPEDADHYEDGEYTGAYAYNQDPLMAPPRLVDPAAAPLLGTVRPPFVGRNSYLSNKSSFPADHEESATLLTARRVKVEDLGPRSSPTAGPSQQRSHSLLDALGLGKLAWFKNADSPRQSIASQSNSYTADPLSEKDLETGRTMLTADRTVDSFGQRHRGVGLGPDGARPKSSISGRSVGSGATLYHDAQSSIPGSRAATPLLAPPPRALTPAEQPMAEHAWFSSPLSGPPAYEEYPVDRSSPAPSLTHGSFSTPAGVDVLDMPIPAAINHFSSISSLKETNTGSSFDVKVPPFPPPGLDTIRPIGWTSSDTATDVTRSRGHGSYDILSSDMSMGIESDITGISIDVLEDAPPDAEQGWRTMASAGFGDAGRRGTFGMYVPGSDFMSEQGSLHSMRSHFDPSARSTGSAPASRYEVGSINSNSSRPSAHSNASRAASSGMHSLARTGSISSDSQKRNRHGPMISPALSAFGLPGHSRPSTAGHGQGQHQLGSEPLLSPFIGSPPSAHMNPNKSSTSRIGSGSTTLMDTSMSTVRGTSPLSASFPLNAPWVGGLDDSWEPSA